MQSCKIKSVKCMQSKKKIKKYACLVNQAAVHKSQTNLKTFSFQRLVLIALAHRLVWCDMYLMTWPMVSRALRTTTHVLDLLKHLQIYRWQCFPLHT